MNKMIPFLKTVDWAATPTFTVAVCNWDYPYCPAITAQTLYTPDGFYTRMTCAETTPRAVIKEYDGLVCTDSCLEWFVDFAPEKELGYLNLECNVTGALHAGFGADRHGRRFLRDQGLPAITVSPTQYDDHWELIYFIPNELVEALYGKVPQSGDVIRANFYKCGDLTEEEHYCSWTVIDAPKPDFHRPEAFGTLVLQ